ncbi:hypothetical protein KEM54_003327 [Ascosphaera aggregata]|nr:hypothetical protein KEM54_003327 [Ascosphaera aggregata]
MSGSVLVSGLRGTPTTCTLPAKARRHFTLDLEQGETGSENQVGKFKRTFFRSLFNSTELDDPPPTYRTTPSSEDAYHALPIMPTMVPRSRTDKHRRTNTKKNTPLFVYYITAIQVIVFIASLIENTRWTGSPIATKPKFNPMIGPSAPILISMGARFVPCIRPVEIISHTEPQPLWPCPKGPPSQGNICTLAQLCGAEAKGDEIKSLKAVPRQWYRFITPMFLHSGIIHLGLVMLAQLLVGCSVEQSVGSLRFSVIYIPSGLAGSLAGANYATKLGHANGPSASLCGITSVFLLDILNQWGTRKFSWLETLSYMTGIIANIGLVLLPSEDGFAHSAGALMGILLGLSLMRSAAPLRQPKENDETNDMNLTTYFDETKVEGSDLSARSSMRKWLKNRKALWWILLAVRFIAASFAITSFVLLIERFYRKTIVYIV